MTSQQLDQFFKNLLDIEGFSGIDPSLNGLQVDNDGGEIGKIAFSVDASLETFKRSAASGAGMLFVHHGLFWGKPQRAAGNHLRRLRFLLDHNLALYAAHLPLDQHPELGNNICLGSLIDMQNPEPFAVYRGRKIGYKGTLSAPLTIEEAVNRIAFNNQPPLGVYPFGIRENRTAAVISGGAPTESLQAVEEGIDLYVTGEMTHQVYHECLEGGLNLIAGGHYATEVWGVRRLMEYCNQRLSIDTEFIDVPTGL
jgi:dinuclear metal center YbgI/SA1388 family protein